eukprot:jgi/Ulvmu1/6431/UM003_0060.1
MKHCLRRESLHVRGATGGAIRAAAVPAVQSRQTGSANVVHPPSPDASSPDITFVGRQKGIKDGIWQMQDQDLVDQVIQSATSRAADFSTHANSVLLGKNIEQLAQLCEDLGHPKYRGKQIHDALMHGATAVNDLNQLPKTLRADLTEANITTGRSRAFSEVTATDGTRKFLRQLHDGRVVETVGIPSDSPKPRLTACVSSQVGCPMRCTFCATGKGGFARGLAAHEIVDQVLTVQEHFDARVSNVVFMGMGEPLLNITAVTDAIKFINKGVGIGARNITISTVGVPRQLERLAQHKLQCVLAVSLHAPNQELRESLVPSARAYPIEQLLRDCGAYFRATSRRVTFEYTLLRGVNDSPYQAQELARVLKQHRLATHVNLIPWNPVEDGDFSRPSRSGVERFRKVLEAGGIEVTVRVTRGLDVAAACGQLRNQNQAKALQEFSPLE